MFFASMMAPYFVMILLFFLETHCLSLEQKRCREDWALHKTDQSGSFAFGAEYWSGRLGDSIAGQATIQQGLIRKSD